MADANTICHDVDLLGDWLDSRGYTEEAGLCLRVLGLIHEQAEENEKLRGTVKYLDAENDEQIANIEELREEIEKLRAALKAVVDDVLISREDLSLALVSDEKLDAAAVALKDND